MTKRVMVFKKKNKEVRAMSENGSLLLSSEDVTELKNYPLTINPYDQYEEDENRFNMVSAQVYQFLKNFKYCTFILFPEISQRGRIHYHGTIVIKNKLQFYLHEAFKLSMWCHVKMTTFERIDTETETKYKSWQEYIEKNKAMMKSLTCLNVYYRNGHMDIGQI